MDDRATRSAGDVAALRRQARAARRQLRRRSAYTGMARELVLGVAQAATLPLRLVPPHGARAPLPEPPGTGGLDPRSLPVVLVHGYAHNRSAFRVLGRDLRRAGFSWVQAFDYRPLADSVEESAAVLAAEVGRALAVSGADRCHIVGHSLGGIVARYYVQELGGAEMVATVATLGSPHRGTLAAYLAPGRAVAQLRPGSELLARLDDRARPNGVRWIAYYADLDATIVPAVSAKLVHPAFAATNVRVRDAGHLSLLSDRTVRTSLVAHLAEAHPQAVAPSTGVNPPVFTSQTKPRTGTSAS